MTSLGTLSGVLGSLFLKAQPRPTSTHHHLTHPHVPHLDKVRLKRVHQSSVGVHTKDLTLGPWRDLQNLEEDARKVRADMRRAAEHIAQEENLEWTIESSLG